LECTGAKDPEEIPSAVENSQDQGAVVERLEDNQVVSVHADANGVAEF